MKTHLTKQCLLLAPLTAIQQANDSAVQITDPGSENTFSAANTMLMDGAEYACAGVYLTDAEFGQLGALADTLGGHVFLMATRVPGGVWTVVEALGDIELRNGITRPEIEDI